MNCAGSRKLSLLIMVSLFAMALMAGCSSGSATQNAGTTSTQASSGSALSTALSADLDEVISFSGVTLSVGDEWQDATNSNVMAVYKLKKSDGATIRIQTFKDGTTSDPSTHIDKCFGQKLSSPKLTDEWTSDDVNYWLYEDSYYSTMGKTKGKEAACCLIGAQGDLGFVVRCDLTKGMATDENLDVVRQYLHSAALSPSDVKYDSHEEFEKQNTGTPSTSTQKPVELSDDDKGMLVADAQAVVKENLKSPSSAKFPWSFDDYVFSSGGSSSTHPGYTRYTIKSYVDADNAYGANLRENFSVTIDYKSGADTYYVVDCNIG